MTLFVRGGGFHPPCTFRGFLEAATDRVNPEHGGLPESTTVAGWVGATPTPVTLLQINSHVQKLACQCPRGFPIMANLFRNIIVHTLSMGDP